MGPPTSGSIMSMKAQKQEAAAAAPPAAPMNLYNPAAAMPQPQQQPQHMQPPNMMQPNMQTNMGPPGVPNMSNSTALPPQQTHIPPQPKKVSFSILFHHKLVSILSQRSA